MKGRVLIIAGSDSGGGAGIQADIKAVTALGAYAATAITALTVQDTKGVYAVHDVPTEFIRHQITVVLNDIGADAIKIGMIGSRAAGEAILEALVPWPDIPVVLDPVLVATSGDRLGDDEVAALLMGEFAKRAHVVTPNLPELEALSGLPVATEFEREEAARRFIDAGAQHVLVKGGHDNDPQITDLLVSATEAQRFSKPRIETTNTHGTGCTLASALAAGVAQGLPLEKAVGRAIDFVHDAIGAAPGLGGGHGPLNHAVWSGAKVN
ncbi:MAG: bifunctional hydroxymethylpyrimidine kinase/phosphomethylpyrimidine kinase [Pseudomonadota bacterium]